MVVIKVTTDDLMSVQDAAKELGRPRLAVYRMIERDDIIGIKLGGILFIPVTEIKRLENEWRQEAELKEKEKQEAEQEAEQKRRTEIERLENDLERLKNSAGTRRPAEEEK